MRIADVEIGKTYHYNPYRDSASPSEAPRPATAREIVTVPKCPGSPRMVRKVEVEMSDGSLHEVLARRLIRPIEDQTTYYYEYQTNRRAVLDAVSLLNSVEGIGQASYGGYGNRPVTLYMTIDEANELHSRIKVK